MKKENQTDKSYLNKIKLLGYGVFIIIVIIYVAIVNHSNVGANINVPDNSNNDMNSSNTILLPDKYNYQFIIKINDMDYSYIGEYNDNVLTIKKNNNEEYIFKNGNYYSKDSDLLVEKDKIYDKVMEEYLNVTMIDTLLNKANYDGNNYRVSLKDIILGSNSDKYITINYTSNENNITIEIDYTNLINYFNNDIEKYIVTMKYDKIID